VLLALLVGLLLVFGILWPLFEAFFDPEMIREASWAVVVFAFACAIAFYFGGMISSYHAPVRRRLHGTLVAPVTFLISPVINLIAGKGPFPEVETYIAAALIIAFFVVALAAAFAGARRGEALYNHNTNYLRRREAAKAKRLRTARPHEE
jgi:FtsH-binding integral membrane protein